MFDPFICHSILLFSFISSLLPLHVKYSWLKYIFEIYINMPMGHFNHAIIKEVFDVV